MTQLRVNFFKQIIFIFAILFLHIEMDYAIILYVFGSIKKIFYKADHWGSLSEINRINKSLWMKDLMVTFIAIPLLLTICEFLH